jgi:iron complex outermembrane receptor protein/hemoglobin/transferrin/lactoferrin receptor protein
LCAIVAASFVATGEVRAQEGDDVTYEGGTVGAPAEEAPNEDERTVETRAKPRRLDAPGDATSQVTREEMEVRQPRSAPDALRYEPGVYVQQTGHAQGSAFIRGRTGQQTVLLFDDVRMNNSLFRQGPNQYFFTIDARTIERIDVVRGSASTRYGSDAVAGVLHARALEPTLGTPEGWALSPRGSFRHATADGELGGRLQLDAGWGGKVGVLAGVGYRDVGQLESGGPVFNPRDGELPEVPRFEDDMRTQRGTGFEELTADVRVVAELGPKARATVAYYDYRQFDAPRTDQCAPPFAPADECLTYDEQFRTLVYGTLDADLGALARRSRFVLSWQRQHERRSAVRPSSFVLNGGRDDVDTWGVLWRADTARLRLGEGHSLGVKYGVDFYRDVVSSAAWITFEDIEVTRVRSRGQYIEGSTYGWGGAWAQGELRLWDQLNVRAGARGSLTQVDAPADVESGTAAVRRQWTPLVGNVGVEWWLSEQVTLLASLDGAFRAPNLDDLTSRQRTGPGYQLENAELEPERGETYEVGARVSTGAFEVDGWAYASFLRDAIARTTIDASGCPPDDFVCRNAWTRLQLVNLPGEAVILGTEGSVRWSPHERVGLTATASYAWSEGPAPASRADEDGEGEGREPLSRTPPLNGTFEALWKPWGGLYLGAGVRWATAQDRLALQDQSDGRIPIGGTPGFVVVDARAGWRWGDRGMINVVFENLTDAAYRYHGSSVNGPGRGVIAQVELGL